MENVEIKEKKDDSSGNDKKSPSIVIDNNQLFSITQENEGPTAKPSKISLLDEETVNLNNTSQMNLLNTTMNQNNSTNLNQVVALDENMLRHTVYGEDRRNLNVTADGLNIININLATPVHTITVTPKISFMG